MASSYQAPLVFHITLQRYFSWSRGWYTGLSVALILHWKVTVAFTESTSFEVEHTSSSLAVYAAIQGSPGEWYSRDDDLASRVYTCGSVPISLGGVCWADLWLASILWHPTSCNPGGLCHFLPHPLIPGATCVITFRIIFLVPHYSGFPFPHRSTRRSGPVAVAASSQEVKKLASTRECTYSWVAANAKTWAVPASIWLCSMDLSNCRLQRGGLLSLVTAWQVGFAHGPGMRTANCPLSMTMPSLVRKHLNMAETKSRLQLNLIAHIWAVSFFCEESNV